MVVMVIVLGEGEAVGHMLRVDFGAFVTVVVVVVVMVVAVVIMVVVVVVAVVIMVVAVVIMVVAMVIMVVVMVVVVVAMVIVTVVVVVSVSATHLQHDKVEGFDARCFEFKHVLAFFKAVNVNHRVRRTSLGAVDAFLSRVVLVALVVVVSLMLVFIVMRFGNHRMVHSGGRPSDVFGLVQHHVIDADLADVPVVAGLVPHVEGPVPRGVSFDTADAGDHVSKGWVERRVQGDVVVAKGVEGEVPTRPVLGSVLVFEGEGGVVGVMNDDHVVVIFVLLVLFFLGGEVCRFIGSFVEMLAQVGDQHRLEFKRGVTVRHGVCGHRLWC